MTMNDNDEARLRYLECFKEIQRRRAKQERRYIIGAMLVVLLGVAILLILNK
jgi:hypothetical protein